MKKKVGTTLFEIIVYLGLFSFIALLNVHWIVQLWQTCIFYERKKVSLINLTTAHDMLIYDLHHHAISTKNWKIRNPSCLIFKKDTSTDIGWMLDKNRLVRIQGVYAAQGHEWRKQSKNIVASAVQKVYFSYHQNNNIASIEFTLSDQYHTIEGKVLIPIQSSAWK